MNKKTNFNMIVIVIVILALIFAVAIYKQSTKKETAYVALFQVNGDIICVNTGTSIEEFRKTNDFMKLMKQPYFKECKFK